MPFSMIIKSLNGSIPTASSSRTVLSVNQGLIEPIGSYQDGLKFIENKEHRDGHIYPPLVRTVTQKMDFETGQLGEDEVIPKSTRPSPVFFLPASHILHVHDPLAKENLRYEDAGLLIHLLAFFFGTRLQFSNWRFDGKVPTKLKCDISYSHDTMSHFISHIYKRWKNLNCKQRKAYINILYMHGKAKSCEWEWDEFIYQYMVFDAIYKFNQNEGNDKAKSKNHKHRFYTLCDSFNIKYCEERIAQIYELRNNLFHEALWSNGTPGQSKKDENSHLIVKCLERLNSKLIVASLHYKNKYSVSGDWYNLCFRGENFDKAA